MQIAVTTRTRASSIAGIAALALIGLGLVLPAFASRSVIRDLFFILTLLTLAQLWNLIAGYGGMVFIGQQAFVGIGAYAMFAGVILWGWDPIAAIPLGLLAAVRDNDTAARSVGVDAARLEWTVFLSAAAMTGMVGALIFLQTARISPDAAFSVTNWTAHVIFIVVIGGIGRLEGPIVGVLVFWGLQTAFADYGAWYLLALGLIAIAVMLFARCGLWGLFAERTGIALFPIQRRLTTTSQGAIRHG